MEYNNNNNNKHFWGHFSHLWELAPHDRALHFTPAFASFLTKPLTFMSLSTTFSHVILVQYSYLNKYNQYRSWSVRWNLVWPNIDIEHQYR